MTGSYPCPGSPGPCTAKSYSLKTEPRGLVQNIDEEKILCLSLGDEQDLEVGGKVIRTKRRAGIPVGSGILGRVVDVLGAPIDGEGRDPGRGLVCD